MKALVLTFDKYRCFAAHMIHCYQEVWPNNPFIFRVPYQGQETKQFFEELFGEKVEMIKSPSGIVDTMFALSDDLDEEEWVYWCMDDRYPMSLNLEELEKCYQFTQSNVSDSVSGLMYSHSANLRLPSNRYKNTDNIITLEGQTFIRRKNYAMIWNHQFLRVKVVRTFFGLFPRVMKQAKEMDYIKDKSKLPDNQKLYFLRENIAVFGESTNRGVVTKNCAESFASKGIEIPDSFHVSDQVLIKGVYTRWDLVKSFLKYYLSRIKKS